VNHPSPCLLTVRDHAILEAMLERCREPDGAYAALLRGKLAGADVRSDGSIPAAVATLDSRVLYEVDGKTAGTRLLTQGPVEGPAEAVLPVTTLRGLALLGLAVGEAIAILENGTPVTLTVRAVTRPPAPILREAAAPEPARPALRLVHSADDAAQPPQQPVAHRRVVRRPFDGDDDPGPSAA